MSLAFSPSLSSTTLTSIFTTFLHSSSTSGCNDATKFNDTGVWFEFPLGISCGSLGTRCNSNSWLTNLISPFITRQVNSLNIRHVCCNEG
ncbi:hypothetical protein LXL04_037095 [Taraxacum kok-saghyz]